MHWALSIGPVCLQSLRGGMREEVQFRDHGVNGPMLSAFSFCAALDEGVCPQAPRGLIFNFVLYRGRLVSLDKRLLDTLC